MTDDLRSDTFLGRQPILNRDQQLVAYELLFRGGRQNAASFSDGRAATASVIRNVFSELSIRDVVGAYRAYINVDEDMLFSDALELLPTDAVALEILETVVPTAEVVERCAELKAMGYMLALDDVVRIDASYAPLLRWIDVVKLDIKAISPDDLAHVVRDAKALGKKVLAEKVDQRAEMRHCRDLGCDLFQGYFFAKPALIEGKRLDHSQRALLQLMNLVIGDADNAQIEAVFKEQPGLALNLLRLTNSVGTGVIVKITSVHHAITVLGRRQLQRWLQLLLYTSDAGTRANPLLQLAATRGRLMELLAERVGSGGKALADDAFMIGILSLTPALLGERIEEIVAGLTLSAQVHAALCEHAGALGDLLTLAELLEGNRIDQVDAMLARWPGLHAGDVNRCLAQALSWANSIGRDDRGA